MRIMLDTNVLISTILFNSYKLKAIINYICDYHKLVLSTYILDELEYVTIRKCSNKLIEMYDFISSLPYEVEYTPEYAFDKLEIEMRDSKDLPVLYSAIMSKVDILITGDKDFEGIIVDGLEIIKPNDFYKKYINNEV